MEEEIGGVLHLRSTPEKLLVYPIETTIGLNRYEQEQLRDFLIELVGLPDETPIDDYFIGDDFDYEF